MERMELRSFTYQVDQKDNLVVTGLVNKTGEWSKVMGKTRKFREKVLPGVFAEAINLAEKVDFLAEHDRNLLLSSTENRGLELYEDSEGLKMKANIAPTSYGKDIYELIKSGLKTHMSFGMKVLKDSWSRGADGIMERVIEKVAISEISAVRNPAYAGSAIEARGIELIDDVDIPEIQEVDENKNKLKKDDVIMNTKLENLVNDLVEERNFSNQLLAGITEEKVFGSGLLSQLRYVKQDKDYTGSSVLFPRSAVGNVVVTDIGIAGSKSTAGVCSDDIIYNEVKTGIVISEYETSVMKLNNLAPEVKDEFIKSQLNIIEETILVTKLANEVNSITELIEPSKLQDALETLIDQVSAELIPNMTFLMNGTTLKNLRKLKYANGERIIEYKMELGKFVYNDLVIEVLDGVTGIALVDFEAIGIAEGWMNEQAENHDTNEIRAGKKVFIKRASFGIAKLDSNKLFRTTIAA